MPLLVDTGVIYALADRRDAWHRRVVDYLEAAPQPLLVPMTVVPEAAYLLRARLGPASETAFASAIANGELTIEALSAADWKRVAVLVGTYEFLGVVDASILAITERLKLRTLATTDRRHFAAVRPSHVERLALVP